MIELVILILMIAVNGLFAMAEIALISARKARLQQWANEGNSRAAAALVLAEEPTAFLSTVQIGITLVGIFAGAFGEATFAERLSAWLLTVPALAPYSRALSLTIVVLSLTYVSLVIGELVPKRLGLHAPERLAATLAGPMNLLSRIAYPVVRVLTRSTELVLALLGIREKNEPPITEEEVKVLFEQGTRAGIFAPAEQDIVERTLRLGARSVAALMTPRTEIAWLDLDRSPAENRRVINEQLYSYYPVGRGKLDHVSGVVRTKELLARSTGSEGLEIEDTVQRPLFVPENSPALHLLETFKQSRTHMALVLDEYGGVQGLVTLNDVLDAIVGDVPTQHETAQLLAVQREDGSWLLDGMLPVDDFRELFELGNLPGEERAAYQTLAGFVLQQMGHIPDEGNQFIWRNLRFEILDMDGLRVDKVMVSTQATPEA